MRTLYLACGAVLLRLPPGTTAAPLGRLASESRARVLGEPLRPPSLVSLRFDQQIDARGPPRAPPPVGRPTALIRGSRVSGAMWMCSSSVHLNDYGFQCITCKKPELCNRCYKSFSQCLSCELKTLDNSDQQRRKKRKTDYPCAC